MNERLAVRSFENWPTIGYRILRVQRLDRPNGLSAALVNVGEKTQVLVFFRQGKDFWWTRFYETELLPPATRPGRR